MSKDQDQRQRVLEVMIDIARTGQPGDLMRAGIPVTVQTDFGPIHGLAVCGTSGTDRWIIQLDEISHEEREEMVRRLRGWDAAANKAP